jgi:hypothetical protein
VRPSLDHTLRYREYATGHSGRLYRESDTHFVSGDAFSNREPVVLHVRFHTNDAGVADSLSWVPRGQVAQRATRIGRERQVAFTSDGTRLTGRLHLPDGPPPYPAIVLVHGSGEQPGSTWFYNGDFMVAHGIAVLAYDKRGTGESGGRFTFDFLQLARDAAAGVAFLRTQPEIRAEHVGLSGYSQGGWVAPLAASLSQAAFVLVSYSMIESPRYEARMEMRALLEKHGVQAPALRGADSLIAAAVEIVASEFENGWEEFSALESRYDDAPWRSYLADTPVGQLMKYPAWLVKLIGRRKLPRGLRWDYDSTALLDTLDIPMTWFLGGQDESAPNALTIQKLERMQASGLPRKLMLFENAAHGMVVFDQDGQRVVTGYAPTYFRAEVRAAQHWIAAAPDPDLE